MGEAAVDRSIKSTEVPKVAVELVAGKMEAGKRKGGIFTKEDMINIKLYAKKGLSLPSKLPEVKVYLGYTKCNIAGLEPPDMKSLFDKVKDHSIQWDNVQNKVIKQGINLEQASKSIVTTGDDFISAIDQWPFYKKLKSLGDAKDETFKGIKLEDPNDKEASVALGQYLTSLKREIDQERIKTDEVTKTISDYRIALSGGQLSNGEKTDGLEPEVKRKSDLMAKNNLKETIKEDEDKLTELDAEIAQLKKDYDKFVGLAFSGAAGGVIGLAITGGIFGAKAEKARKKKNKKIEERKTLQAKLTGEKNLQKAIQDLSNDFDDIGIRMIDAEQALTHLDYMWMTMGELIESSQKEWENINDGLRLLAFIDPFKKIINPWREVGDLAGYLIKIIDEALEEYKKTYEKA